MSMTTMQRHRFPKPILGAAVLAASIFGYTSGYQSMGGGRTPARPSINCAGSIVDHATGNCIVASSTPALGQLVPMGSDLFISPIGNVGVGTTDPSYKLEVTGDISGGSVMARENYPAFRLITNNGEGDYRWEASPDGKCSFIDGVDGEARVVVTPSGAIGIGTSNPLFMLDVNGDLHSQGISLQASHPAIKFAVTTGIADYEWMAAPDGTMSLRDTTRNANRIKITHSGAVGIGTDNPLYRLDVNGDVAANTLVIRGGADIVEGFKALGEQIEPGTVMVQVPEQHGVVCPSTKEYDRLVIGVVSGAGGVHPGLMLTQEEIAGETPIAMVGRIFVKCSIENGPIGHGDLLTTSSTPGHAMKATDRERAFGCVIGKALGTLDNGEGLVLVLVGLQ